ncbi:LysR family transcriptional regulator [Limosilactobacillus sp.]|uniref:LysR family transcriptional regulator n=1 Tax=Limosilactobacillus sp. TaxID=2773925 RepID=UPI00345E7373
MIDYYLLEELVTFADTKTLAKTAEKLMVTQPTITRGMQKLEDELGVQLFHRQPNRIELTKTGQEAVRGARKLLADNQQFVTNLRNYDNSHQQINIATVAPGPIFVARQVQLADTPVKIESKFVHQQDIPSLLTNHKFSLIFTNQEIQTDDIESIFIGQERLSVNLDQFMYLANQQSVTFKELEGLSFVVLEDIGPWKDVIQEHIPNAKFLYQAQRDALAEITRYSNFPYFNTNITSLNPPENAQLEDNDRVTIPITDPAATMTFYAAYLKSDRKRLQPVIKQLAKKWPKI